MKKKQNILPWLTVAIFLILLLQTMFHFIGLKPLKGYTVSKEMPQLTLESYKNGTFQRDFEIYNKERSGFREWSLRLYNQYIWTCYHKTFNGWIDIGKDNWLYETEFVRDHYESMMYKYTNDSTEMKKTFDEMAENLAKLQGILKEHGTYIFVNMLPGKDIIYPEYLPESTKYHNPAGIHAYDYLKKRFDELGVNYIDNVELFKQMKDSVDYQLFPKTGTHRSNIAATHAFDTIMRYMESLNGMNLLNVSIGEKYRDRVREPDDDLEQLFNLVFPIKPNKNYYADVTIIPDSTAVKPNLITIGDSFFWTITYNYPLQQIFNRVPYWYYNSTIYYDPDNKTTKDINMLHEIFDADYIMLNYCTVQLYKLGNGFIDNAMELLYDKETQQPVSQDVINMIQHIYSDKNWFNDIKAKAESNNISVERQVALDAKWILEQQEKEPTAFHYPESKIWKHGVYSKYDAAKYEKLFDGMEVDIVYSTEKDDLFIGRVEDDANNGNSFDDWLAMLEQPQNVKLWIDFKNLSKDNCIKAIASLEKLVSKYDIKNNVLVENQDLDALSHAKQSGFHVILWVDNLHYWRSPHTRNDSISICKTIRNKINKLHPDAISSEFTAYPMLCDSFPEQNIHFWDTPKDFTDENVRHTQELCRNKSVKVVLVDYPQPIQ